MNIPEDVLIEYIKPNLKAKGFKKKNKRWLKTEGEFTLSFLIQGSNYDKDTYYIRPGVFINAMMPTDLYYGHFKTDIPDTTPEEVIESFDEFCRKWTDKARIKRLTEEFIEWEKRNPLEKRRAGLADYDNDPPPSHAFFHLSNNLDRKVLDYIIEHF